MKSNANPMITKIKYLALIPVGFLILYLGSFLQQVTPPNPGENYYSCFLKNNYTEFTAILFMLAGLATGYFFKLNHWLTGISLILILPLTSLYEILLYPTSHNLIPFELAMHLSMALPAVAGAYLGKLLQRKIKQ